MTALREVLSDLKHGDHLCPVYDTLEQRHAFIAAFVAPALARRERCVVVTTPRDVEAMLRDLVRYGVNVAAGHAADSLHVLTHTDTFMRSGVFSPDAMLDYLADIEHDALADGFQGVRYVGEMSWASGDDEERQLLEYEFLLDRFLRQRPMIAACLYRRDQVDGAVVHDILRAHSTVILGDTPLPNPYYEPAQLLLEPDTRLSREFKRQRVDWWIQRLRAVATAEQESTMLREALHEAQKMESVGRLVGGVAHDFNNLLTVITGSLDLLDETITDSADRELLADIQNACKRSVSLTRQLLAFSRRDAHTAVHIDLNKILLDLQSLLQRLLGERIRIDYQLAPTPQYVLADPGRMQQILMNLTINAADAMPDGGTLTLATQTRNLDAEEAAEFVDDGLEAGPHVILSVGDTGSGIAPEYLERVFEPFFTTKEAGRGTGLGLPVVFGIVKESHGAIRVDSTPGRGTTFTILLPVTSEHTLAQVAPPEEEDAAPGRETVLVVEDEQALRTLMRRMLEASGYRVLTAGTGAEARRILGAAAAIDLIMSDIGLPDVDGEALIADAGTMRPGIRTLLLSGYSAADLASRRGGAPIGHFLQKPFSTAQLQKTVRAALEDEDSDPDARGQN